MNKKLNNLFARMRSLLSPEFLEAGEQGSPGSLEGLKALFNLSQTMNSMRSVEEVLDCILSEIEKQFGFSCGVLMVEEDGFFRVRAHRGFSAAFVGKFQVRIGEGAVGQVYSLHQKKTILKPEFAQYPDFVSAPMTDWGAVYLMPVAVQSQTLGVLIAGAPDPDLFGEETSNLIVPYLQVLAVGIHNSLLMDRLEKFNRRLEAEVLSTTEELTRTNLRLIHRVRELKALYEITLSAEKGASPEEFFHVVSERVKELMGTDTVGFFINRSSREDAVKLVAEAPSFGLTKECSDTLMIESGPGVSRPLPSLLSRTVLEAYTSGEVKSVQGGPSALREIFSEDLRGGFPSSFAKIVYRSFAAVPLKTAQKSFGVMVLVDPLKEAGSLLKGDHASSQALPDEIIRTLAVLASRVATMLENLELAVENKGRMSDLLTLKEIGEAFYVVPVLEFVLGKIIKITLRSLACDLCTFMFFEPDKEEVVAHPAADTAEESQSAAHAERDITIQVFRDGKPRIIDDIESARIVLEHSGSGKHIRSVMYVPLRVENKVVSLLRLGSRSRAFFSSHHLRLAELIADRAAVVVENARLYEKILQANKELERLNRVKTEFVSMVSHELRTPVTAIKGFVDIVYLEEAGALNDQQKNFLQIARNSINRLSLIIADLLDISRIESGQFKMEVFPVNLNKILGESAESYRHMMGPKQIQFKLQLDTELPEILADEARIKQVVGNLISNAVKFTPSGGTICLISDDMGDFALVGVTDTGTGIRKEDQDRIFEKFYQADSSLTRQVGGTGLGLAISKSIVEMHGGRIWVESEPGKGASFRFLLPRVRQRGTKSNGNIIENLSVHKKPEEKEGTGQ